MNYSGGKRAQSVPTGLGSEKDDVYDKDFDKLFKQERFDPATLNPEGQGNVDVGRKYYRSASIDGGGQGEDEEGDEGESPVKAPTRDAVLKRASIDGAFFSVKGHDSEFPQNKSIIKKNLKKGEIGKKRHRKPSESAQQLPVIRGVEVEEDPDEAEGGGQESDEGVSEASLPWKAGIYNPVIDTEHSSSANLSKDVGSPSVFSEKGPETEKKKAKFTLGFEDDDDDEFGELEEDVPGHRQYRKPNQSRKTSRKEDDQSKRKASKKEDATKSKRPGAVGAAGADGAAAKPVTEDDLQNLKDADIEDIGSHRFEKAAGWGRHKIKKTSVSITMEVDQEPTKTERAAKYGFLKEVDHTPHHLFVEMDELEGEEWVEKARWIKYEEDLEADAGRWGKPHVSTLTFRSLLNVRKSIETGVMLLDLQEVDLPGVAHRVVEELSVQGYIAEQDKPDILRLLNYRHKHVEPHHNTFRFGLKRNTSNKSLPGISDDPKPSKKKRSFYSIKHSSQSQDPESEEMLEGQRSSFGFETQKSVDSETRKSFMGVHRTSFGGYKSSSRSQEKREDSNSNVMEKEDEIKLEMDGLGATVKRSSTGLLRRSDSFTEQHLTSRKQDILACLEEGTEGCLTLVGPARIEKTVSAFVRLANSIVMNNTIEVNLPMRFIFILLTPENDFTRDPHEIGRSFSTLMSNVSFHDICYRVERKREMLHAINVFLDDSVVLPPGDWHNQKLLGLGDIMDVRKRRQERRQAALLSSAATASAEGVVKPPLEEEVSAPAGGGGGGGRNPLERTNIPFGGVINDIKYRYRHYWSDIKDGFSPQCLAAIIFIYFAALSGAIAFGGLMGAKTNNDIAISETLIMSSLSGIVFALFAGCPLIIIGPTGPILLYDEALYKFSQSNEIEFLAWRTWIGIWTLVIALVVAFFQGSVLVKHFTKFTKDIFASLVALIFIYEALLKLYKVFQAHPLLTPEDYCAIYSEIQNNDSIRMRREIGDLFESETETTTLFPETATDLDFFEERKPMTGDLPHPNTALQSAILMFGTFLIAYFLRLFRNSRIFGRNVRRALGDFGVPIAIVAMVMMDYASDDTYTEKLFVPAGLTVTKNDTRDWFIPPTGISQPLPIWAMFAAFLPAILLYVLLFMETHICELIMMEKTKGPNDKGAGVHLDIVLLSAINMFTGLFGGPWICAATVRAVSHVSALLVISTNVIPGESARVVGAIDQRLTALCVSIMLGASILLAPILKLVPFAVLFGVFLYMGVSGLNGVQLFDRIILCIMPVKHHPQVSYVKHVKTWRMVLFTVFQGLGLITLWVVKSTAASLAFPFFVIGMIPYRRLLGYIFTQVELDALDGPNAGKDLTGQDDEDDDFYETAADCPIVPNSAVPLHRSIMEIVKIPGVLGKLESFNGDLKKPE